MTVNLDQLLSPSQELSWDLLDLIQEDPVIPKSQVCEQLLTQPEAINRTTFRFKRKGINGAISGYSEEIKKDAVGQANSMNSLSVTRKFSSKSESLRGKTSFLPFQPGGLVSSSTQPPRDDSEFLHRNDQGLFDIPQGFERGLRLATVVDTDHSTQTLDLEAEAANGNNDDKDEDYSLKFTETDGDDVEEVKDSSSSALDVPASEIDGLVPFDHAAMLMDQLMIKKPVKKDWAHVVDLNHKIENFSELVPNPARTWPFELDTFQKEAVYHLEQGDSVFVAAHTSAGKTVVAEYAIAMAARNMTKAIYTSPIKALSNQKFRDFKETFPDMDIGLITGDVQINPEANCLIMTTEILRSMLYRGADLIRDVEFVIFDEVHYVNDIERGVVWEEVIIMLPDHVKYILLSATVPNTFEFANWVGRTKHKDIYVISTPKRPVPLEMFIYAKQKMFKVVDANRKFVESEFTAHRDLLDKPKPGAGTLGHSGTALRGGRGGTARGGNRGGGRGGGGGGGRGGRGGAPMNNRGNFAAKTSSGRGFARDGPSKNTWQQLVQYLKGNNLLPAVIFVFSKKKCEEWADSLSTIDFCNAREKSEIHMFIDRAVSRLKKEDRELPQILKVRDMLSRGVAVHHGGLLPIVKECIEILFAKSLIKVLFATETFAMGLNLPTRTVVFSQLRKNDGRSFRNLLPGEFTQMAGRAGRRGLDSTGTVILMAYTEPLAQSDFKEITLGLPTKLSSQFRLTYNMILNLLRIEALRVEEMIKHSFSENSTQVLLPENKTKLEKLQKSLLEVKVTPCDECQLVGTEETFELMQQYQKVYSEICSIIGKSPVVRSQLLNPGRMVIFRHEGQGIRVGFVVRSLMANSDILVLTFNHGKFAANADKYQLPYVPVRDYLKRHMSKPTFKNGLNVVATPVESIQLISRYTLRASINAIIKNDPAAVAQAGEEITKVLVYFPKLQELTLARATQLSLHDLLVKKAPLIEAIAAQPALHCSQFKEHYRELREKQQLLGQIEDIQKMISDENLELLPDYEQRLEVLQELGFINEHHNVVLKGRVACEVNSGWELVITELILDNFLGDFEPEEIVALLSCFVYEGRTNEEEPPCMTPRLEKGKKRILEITGKLIKVFSDHQVVLTTDEEEFLDRKRFALVNVVYEWARGLSFNEIMQMSVEAEGTIVRVITRLDEVCREVKNAALIVGDSQLHSKMSEAQERIKRDIVFCASLYL
ncbi:hypothetical protein DIURU_000253 [Diutina rugosa]|uniref:Antiviral helicase SKI2 n=1 Tax=Diutina rugosa TaxID=5481 RepID=A0A642UZC8_DIURU|nr:uncharacterized protein DIURU_000253 [Diutina rugosa]KAA8908284.1 hypothetical protein DIURU_000253 [Diutina rugosa]